jgi:type VI protein secretion system component VasK
MPLVNVAELGLLLAALVLPLILGVVAALTKRPWWRAAIVAVVVAMIATIAPAPEPGEARVVAGDIPFLLIVAAVASGLVWLAYFLTRRLRKRSETNADQLGRNS